MGFYDLQVSKPNGDIINLSEFKGKAVLIVNTATQCGLTPQFEGLEKLHQDYFDEGLVVLGFPCNQFMGQEPLTNESMEESCQLNHGVTFQLTEKVEVNGKGVHPVFKYLKEELSGGLFGKKVKWNFTKFLISRDGLPMKRYAPITKPESLVEDIKNVLK
jgi:glutathione peroxidase